MKNALVPGLDGLKVWSFEGEHFNISPAQVRQDPALHHSHHVQAMASDLAFPLHVLVRANRVVTVLDGFHRLFKADVLGQQTIAVKKVSPELLDTFACSPSGRSGIGLALRLRIPFVVVGCVRTQAAAQRPTLVRPDGMS